MKLQLRSLSIIIVRNFYGTLFTVCVCVCEVTDGISIYFFAKIQRTKS